MNGYPPTTTRFPTSAFWSFLIISVPSGTTIVSRAEPGVHATSQKVEPFRANCSGTLNVTVTSDCLAFSRSAADTKLDNCTVSCFQLSGWTSKRLVPLSSICSSICGASLCCERLDHIPLMELFIIILEYKIKNLLSVLF